MTTKPTNEFENFIDVLVDELIAMPDDQVLEGLDPASVQADGLRLLQAAKVGAGRARLAAAKAGFAALKGRPGVVATEVSAEDARRFITQATNDGRYTLAARSLGELSDDEVLKLYRKLKALESGADGAEK
ncbi:hypothetical protein [Ralstonia pseudosolanacearum]|uniref:hypothetical protein n=1 Tax=Ralstonia pseudosolanacearum TaxID=1310165 RepID=UPI000B61BB17|nr:hypothetical protein [Ralstonia pseudosolanacearum]QIK24949.1 hypothetical protein G7939_16890 [Ralstonia solanacearum]ASL73567.1 hypothetical protein BC350_07890 [Ralstonia pseudosolanacearum]MCK4120624.1 hypothetical protein [Ralstonia pseudosolanacearum]MCK4155442.1 hypothetical protein [Ralstonia pseudosolanacearum]QIK27015.1 hypothetical protein G7947_00930 [Ralstonia solanacearum]